MKSIKLILVLLLCAGAVYAQDDIAISTRLKLGDKLPAFTTLSLDGKTLSSSELRGKVVLVNFWATWCGPCKSEMPFIQKDIFDAIKTSDFQMLAVSRGEESEIVKKFIAQNKYTFPIYLDKDKKVYELFAERYIPRNFLFGKDGSLKFSSAGYTEKDFKELMDAIKKELN